MPIVDIEIVNSEASPIVGGLAKKLADSIAVVLGTPPGRVWVKLRLLPTGMYAEDGAHAPAVHPVFVSVLKSELPPVEELRTEASQLAVAIAILADRPVANVHVIYQPPAAGRIAFGGDLLVS